jgi:hypothetical protein
MGNIQKQIRYLSIVEKKLGHSAAARIQLGAKRPVPVQKNLAGELFFPVVSVGPLVEPAELAWINYSL